MTVTGDMGASLEPSSGPLVSVVVPTRNSARTIERCLQSIVGQRPTRLELIVVDNDSTDGTFAIATSYADVVLRAGPERSAQRNVGVARSGGDYVMWIDSDMELIPGTIRAAVAAGADVARGTQASEIRGVDPPP